MAAIEDFLLNFRSISTALVFWISRILTKEKIDRVLIFGFLFRFTSLLRTSKYIASRQCQAYVPSQSRRLNYWNICVTTCQISSANSHKLNALNSTLPHDHRYMPNKPNQPVYIEMDRPVKDHRANFGWNLDSSKFVCPVASVVSSLTEACG